MIDTANMVFMKTVPIPYYLPCLQKNFNVIYANRNPLRRPVEDIQTRTPVFIWVRGTSSGEVVSTNGEAPK